MRPVSHVGTSSTDRTRRILTFYAVNVDVISVSNVIAPAVAVTTIRSVSESRSEPGSESRVT